MLTRPIDMIYIKDTPFFGHSISNIQMINDDMIALDINNHHYTIQTLKNSDKYTIEYRQNRGNRIHINGNIYPFRIVHSY